jgi:glycosyltransferase involved in cell wall biosynthesis
MNPPTVSVLLPVYNAGRYLAESIRSVLDQTFGDFELIAVDDDSTDSSPQILRRFARRDPRVRLVRHENRGLVASLNEMIGMARGEFLARMDADDVALPDRLALQVDYLRKHPDVVALGGSTHWIDERGFVFMDQRPPCDDEEIQEALLQGANCFVHPAVMMRRQAVLDVGGYDPEMKEGEDFDLWLRLGERGRLANLEDFMLKYRVHGKSLCSAAVGKHGHYARLACQNACRRRGIEQRDLPEDTWMPPDFEERFGQLQWYGWQQFLDRRRWTALRYALHLVHLAPRRLDGWRLLACSLVKPVRRTA